MESKVVVVEEITGEEEAVGCGGSSMITKLVDAFFGCWHNRYSFPITVRSSSRNPRPTTAAALTGTYVVCLDCGRELPYDWKEMKVIGSASEARHYARELATRQAA
jgi:hypothetical protein